ncbi:hypothetical protein AwDysgo_01790 [Bacteroidales bacterium]|nr:hypothetical protein AwDysgo_01790 [Bacteroidales bacterium]
MIKTKIRKEHWLPVVNEVGGVIGKVTIEASSISSSTFLHPVVRIVVLHKNMLYLVKKKGINQLKEDCVDYPFEQLVSFEQGIGETVNSLIGKENSLSKHPVRFLFKYLYQTPCCKRLVYLHAMTIDDARQMQALNSEDGKLWTEKQIKENIGKGVFSELLEKEFEFLESTIFQANQIMNTGHIPEAVSQKICV